MSVKSEPTTDNIITDNHSGLQNVAIKKEILPDNSASSATDKSGPKPAAYLVKNPDQTFTLISNGADLSSLKSGNSSTSLTDAIKKLIPQLINQNKGQGLRMSASLQPGSDGKLQLVMPIQSSANGLAQSDVSQQCSVGISSQPTIQYATSLSSSGTVQNTPNILPYSKQTNENAKVDKSLLGQQFPRGCNCKKSHCLKNYCECYEAKNSCSVLCKCTGCANIDGPNSRASVSVTPTSMTSSSTTITTSTFSQINHLKRPVVAAVSVDAREDTSNDPIVIDDDSDSNSSVGKKPRLESTSPYAMKSQTSPTIRKEVSIMPRLIPASVNTPKYQLTNASGGGSYPTTTLTLPPNFTINDIMAAVNSGRATLVPQSLAPSTSVTSSPLASVTSVASSPCRERRSEKTTGKDFNSTSVKKTAPDQSVKQPTIISNGAPGIPSLIMMPSETCSTIQNLKIRIPLSLLKTQLARTLEVPQVTSAQKAFLQSQKLQLEFTPKTDSMIDALKTKPGVKPSAALTAAYVQRHINAAIAACNNTTATTSTKTPGTTTTTAAVTTTPAKLPIMPLRSFASTLVSSSPVVAAVSVTKSKATPSIISTVATKPMIVSTGAASLPQITSVTSVLSSGKSLDKQLGNSGVNSPASSTKSGGDSKMAPAAPKFSAKSGGDSRMAPMATASSEKSGCDSRMAPVASASSEKSGYDSRMAPVASASSEKSGGDSRMAPVTSASSTKSGGDSRMAPVASASSTKSGGDSRMAPVVTVPTTSSAIQIPSHNPQSDKGDPLSMSLVRQGVTLRILTRQMKCMQMEMSRMKRLMRHQKMMLNRALKREFKTPICRQEYHISDIASTSVSRKSGDNSPSCDASLSVGGNDDASSTEEVVRELYTTTMTNNDDAASIHS